VGNAKVAVGNTSDYWQVLVWVEQVCPVEQVLPPQQGSPAPPHVVQRLVSALHAYGAPHQRPFAPSQQRWSRPPQVTQTSLLHRV
jgi:hypothetical protein